VRSLALTQGKQWLINMNAALQPLSAKQYR
jgi:hypothetical protein